MKTRIVTRKVDAFMFEHHLQMPLDWFSKARELRRAASLIRAGIHADGHALRDLANGTPYDEALHAAPRLTGQWCMLLAFMLENVFRGLSLPDSQL